MKASDINSKKSPFSYDQASYYLIKWPLLKLTYFNFRTSQFIKHLSSITLEVNTLLQLQTWFLCIIGLSSQNREKNLPPFLPPHHKGGRERTPPQKIARKNGA